MLNHIPVPVDNFVHDFIRSATRLIIMIITFIALPARLCKNPFGWTDSEIHARQKITGRKVRAPRSELFSVFASLRADSFSNTHSLRVT